MYRILNMHLCMLWLCMRTCLQVDIIFKKAAIEEEKRFAGKKGEIDSLISQHIEAEK